MESISLNKVRSSPGSRMVLVMLERGALSGERRRGDSINPGPNGPGGEGRGGGARERATNWRSRVMSSGYAIPRLVDLLLTRITPPSDLAQQIRMDARFRKLAPRLMGFLLFLDASCPRLNCNRWFTSSSFLIALTPLVIPYPPQRHVPISVGL